ncbi:MAG: tyrosine-type recombinase/integrase [Scytonema hyalinum WJT4-NPBG1]|nr:tyrosine-type recombinase/integrase [Scytonema hyalinum WJT4-NPBG1]
MALGEHFVPSHPFLPGFSNFTLSLFCQSRLLDRRPRFLFPSERGLHISPDAVRKLLKRTADISDIDIKVHPHMFCHACGYFLANKGYNTRKIQDYLGHRNINYTEHYTKLNANRFKDFTWDV